MDFLLECIGFPPDYELERLIRLVRDRGEPVAWRGPRGVHLRYPLAGGLEVRLDQEEEAELPSVWPHFETSRRLRVRVQDLWAVADSPYDAHLVGLANPPIPLDDGPDLEAEREDYTLTTYLTDARRVAGGLPRGQVIAVSIAGFALDLSYLGPNQGVRDPFILEEPHGARLLPVGDATNPGGCMDVSLRIQRVRHLENPLTGIPVEVLETDAPGRPLDLFVSRWQLDEDGLEAPRPGSRVEGAFVFTGRISGGLPPARRRRVARRV